MTYFRKFCYLNSCLCCCRLSRYSLTSPYGQLYNTDSSFGPRKAKIIHSWISFRKADYSCKNSGRIASCQRNGLLNTLRTRIWLIWLRATAKQFLSIHKKALSNSKRNERNTCFCFIVTFHFRWTGQSTGGPDVVHGQINAMSRRNSHGLK